MSHEESERTPEELRLLEQMTAERGREYVEENEELILAQARLVGDL